jgi:putative IMPACT (imprinted ancient) family translation regulator
MDTQETMSRKRPRSPSRVRDDAHVVFVSNPIEDRGSTHIGLYSPTATAKELQARPDVKEASHRIAAWRTPGKQRSLSGKPIYELGHDDDGEQYAGKKLERLLADLNVEGAVVVARWYGGILLGPVRFTHFENCAREAISKWRQEVGEEAKRRKVEEDEKAEQESLAKALEQRDSSIAVLRDLLVEKTKKDGEVSSQPTRQEPAKKTDYSSMGVPTLRRLEKARDGTLAWILKQIDKAEEMQKEKEESTSDKVTAEEAQARSEEAEAAEEGHEEVREGSEESGEAEEPS